MTRKQAIDKHCKECIYDEGAIGSGSWRKQVSDCTSYTCNLYNYRPLDSINRAHKTRDKIAGFTPEELEVYERKGVALKERFKD